MDVALSKLKKIPSLKGSSSSMLQSGNFKPLENKIKSYRKTIRRLDAEQNALMAKSTEIGKEIEFIRQNSQDVSNPYLLRNLEDELAKINRLIGDKEAEKKRLESLINEQEEDLKKAKKIAKDIIKNAAKKKAIGMLKSSAVKAIAPYILPLIGIILLVVVALMVIDSIQRSSEQPLQTVLNTRCLITNANDPNCLKDLIENSLNQQYSESNRGAQ